MPASDEVYHWPGQVLTQEDLPYDEAMQRYAQLTRERLERQKVGPILPEERPSAWREEWEARAERHRVLQKRRQEDGEWRTERQAHHQIVAAYRSLSRRGRAAQASEWQVQKERWAQREQERKAVLTRRAEENQAWHQRNLGSKAGQPRSWIAILVITDNCTRQCLGLPLFINGPKLRAEEVVTALRTLLPKELAFLISDQGTHFRSKALAQLAHEANFIQIPIYRHRPQSNGIAERFVLTLKRWLGDQIWTGAEELAQLLLAFRPTYNDRPHQGLPIPVLSPNEFANRIWLM